MNTNIYKSQALITQELEILEYDDFPYFYVGKNIFGNFVVGSLADYDEDSGKKLFLHLIADEGVLLNHFKGNISYLSVMRKAKFIYEVQEDISGQEKNVKPIVFSEIPDDILPENTSFYLLDLPTCFHELEKIVQTKKQPNQQIVRFSSKPQKTVKNSNIPKDAISNRLFTVQTI